MQFLSVTRRLNLKDDIHERLQIIETKRGAVAPGTGLILERWGKGRCKERALLAHSLPDPALMFPHRSVVAGRLDELFVPILFLPLLNCRWLSHGRRRGTAQVTEETGGRQRPKPADRRETSNGSDRLLS